MELVVLGVRRRIIIDCTTEIVSVRDRSTKLREEIEVEVGPEKSNIDESPEAGNVLDEEDNPPTQQQRTNHTRQVTALLEFNLDEQDNDAEDKKHMLHIIQNTKRNLNHKELRNVFNDLDDITKKTKKYIIKGSRAVKFGLPDLGAVLTSFKSSEDTHVFNYEEQRKIRNGFHIREIFDVKLGFSDLNPNN